MAERQINDKVPRPPDPFTLDVVFCPGCQHGIDPHGLDPGGICGVGDRYGVLCGCRWSPNDIAGTLLGWRVGPTFALAPASTTDDAATGAAAGTEEER